MIFAEVVEAVLALESGRGDNDPLELLERLDLVLELLLLLLHLDYLARQVAIHFEQLRVLRCQLVDLGILALTGRDARRVRTSLSCVVITLILPIQSSQQRLLQLDRLLVLRRERLHLLGQLLTLLDPGLSTASADGLLLHLGSQLCDFSVLRILHLLDGVKLLSISLDQLLLEFLNFDAHQVMFILKLPHIFIFISKLAFLLVTVLLGQRKFLLYESIDLLQLLVFLVVRRLVLTTLH